VNKARSTVVIDQHVGKRIHQFRTMLGLTQGQFGDLIGVTPQQVFRYERGVNGVSASRLYEIARRLEAPPEYFFEGLNKSEYRLPPGQRRLLKVMRNIGEINSEEYREAISQIVRALAGH
jgi:transcriptional regulator with XRE-family HTH domain